jgi:penicillin-binding protein 1A
MTLIVIAILGVIGTFIHFSNELKTDLDKLVNYKPALTTQIYDRNGELLANIFDKEHRLYASYDEIPPRLIEALVAIEDTVFFEHEGVNYEAIFRAVVKDLQHMKLKEGASTLTQQLIKNTVLSSEKKLKRKINEAILAIRLESRLTKEEILERYLNEIYFGHRYYGVKTAAQGYFRKSLSDLNLKEIAMLVGLPKAPSTYDPTKHKDLSYSRANTVLKRMNTLGWITDVEFQKYTQMRPEVYNDSLSKNRAPFIVNEVLKRMNKKFKDVKSGGYQIYTTVDFESQQLAKKSLQYAYEGIIERGNKFNKNAKELIDYSDLNGAIVAVESRTGEIMALVGGLDYKSSAFNRAVQSKRQPGSSFKPFIYQIALDLGYSTQSKLTDISRTFKFQNIGEEEKEWKPKNYEKNFKGEIPLREALVHSRNLATINLVNEIGLSEVHKSISKMGFKNVPNDLSIALGTFGISMLDFSSFYTIFSNYGEKLEPILIKKIVFFDGKEEIYEAKREKITSPEQAYLMISILRDVVKRGTGTRVKVKGIEIAGKTGTTNKYKDAWFCGFSPEVEVLAWFGKDDNKKMAKETGGKAAGPAVRYFFESFLKLHPETKREFEIPYGIRVSKVNGKDEYFSETSKPSGTIHNTPAHADEELLF